MKRILLFVLVISMLFTFFGCKDSDTEATSAPAETTQPATVSPTEPSETEPPITVKQQPLNAVSLPITVETVTAEDGTILFVSRSQTMALTVQDPDVAHKIILDFLARTDFRDNNQTIIDSAKKLYPDSKSNLPLWSQIHFEPQRMDQSVLSLYGYNTAYDGSVHGNTGYFSVSYDLLTGDVLTLSGILTETTTAETLAPFIIESLDTQSASLFADYKEKINEQFCGSTENFNDWYLSSEGLCFYFSPYEIGPYATGDVIATIPYTKLTGILQDAFFPPERDLAVGQLITADFETVQLENFSQFTELILDENGKKILIYTDSSIQDIRISQQTTAFGSSDHTETFTVFAATALTPGDAIVIQLPSEGTVTITYTTNGQEFTETLSVQ